MCKVLAIGDLHIQPDTLSDVEVFLVQLDKYLKTVSNLDLIVILGDTLHTHETVYTECMNKMLKYIKLCESYAPTKVLVGNHDFTSNQMFLNDSHPFVGWKKSHNIIDRVHSEIINNVKLTFLPYVPDGRFHEALRTLEGSSDCKCIFAHQLFDGVKMGPIIAQGVEKWEDDMPMIISGHIHDKQRPQKNLYYTGSSMQISFGERDDHTISLVTINNNDDIIIDEIDINPPKKKTVYFDISSFDTNKIKSIENTKLKLSLSGNENEFKTFKKSDEYKKLLSENVKVVFKQKRDVIIDLPTTTHDNFPDILYSLVKDDSGILDVYNQICGIRKVNSQVPKIIAEIIFE